MQTVILAGGKGTRLGPLTRNVPKPMVLIHGKPFLQHLLEYIRSCGLRDVLILVGYLAERIMEYFEDGSELGLNIRYSREDRPLGTGGALKNAERRLATEFLLLNGDTFLSIDYRALVDCFHRNNALGTITVYDNPERIFRNNVALGASGSVIAYDKQASKDMAYVDAGAMALKKPVLDLIPGDRHCALEEEILETMIRTNQIAAYITRERFYDIGTLEGIKALEAILT